jgi:hypothetical protein
VDAETLAGWFGVTGKSVRELAERCMIEPAGGSHARAVSEQILGLSRLC